MTGAAPAHGPPGTPPPRRVAYLACLANPGLGDLLQRNILLGVLRRAFPGAATTLVVGRTVARRFADALAGHVLAEAVLACPDPADDRLAWSRWTPTLRAGAFDACVVDVDSARLDATTARHAGIPVRIGVPGGDAGAVTHPVRVGAPLFGRPDLYEYARALARAAGLASPPRASEAVPPLPLRPERVPELAHPRPLVVLHPGGAPHWNRRWPLDRFAELGARLAAERGASVVAVGDHDEREELERITRAVRRAAPGAVVGARVAPPLNLLGNLLAGADLLVGNDSGPAHVAAAVGTPTVVVYGPTGTEFLWARVYTRHAGVSLRYPCQQLANLPADVRTTPCAHACARRYAGADGPYPRCLEDVTTEQVLAAAARQLDRLPAATAGRPRA